MVSICCFHKTKLLAHKFLHCCLCRMTSRRHWERLERIYNPFKLLRVQKMIKNKMNVYLVDVSFSDYLLHMLCLEVLFGSNCCIKILFWPCDIIHYLKELISALGLFCFELLFVYINA